jgi:uncharacterized membrane protein YjjP (DUF1212 family)
MTAPDPDLASDDRALHAFVLELGRELSLAGTAVTETQDRLERVAAANNAPGARVIVLPTALLISLGAARHATMELIPQRTGALRLDQIAALYTLTKDAERGVVTPAEGLRRLDGLRALRPRYGRLITLAGYTLMTVGLCLVLQPTLLDVAIAAVLGALVGMLVLATRGHQTAGILVPLVAATAVSAVTFFAVQHGMADPGLRVLIAPLVTFLPGGALTTATVELASGEMVAGASRLVFGGLQLLLLGFGIVAGAELVGLPSERAVQDVHVDLLGRWAPWLGVLIFGVACALYFSAPRGTLRWLLLVLAVAWLAQLAGQHLIGANVSGFAGALAMTPVALAVGRLPSGPPPQVTFLPAFWLLVPGAIGLIGVTKVIGDPAHASAQAFIEPAASIIAIALGVLCGVSLYQLIDSRRPTKN